MLLKENAAGECLVCHTESINKRTYGNMSVSWPNIRSFYCHPVSVESYHGSAMSVVTIRCH